MIKRSLPGLAFLLFMSDLSAQHDHHQHQQQPANIAAQPAGRLQLQPGKTVRYDLYVDDTIVNFTGKKKKAIAINGSIPAPTLVFTEGDTAEIYLHNRLDEETSLHWHGVILPNQADGVPWLTTAPIGPGKSHLYRFAVVQNGTYWYHSHSGLQEQSGMYGALIFRKRVEDSSLQFQHDLTVVLSEWTDDKPMQVQRRLRAANDWFSIKKNAVQSYGEALRAGHFGTKFENEWKRMRAMDVSDVYYEKFLLNGVPQSTQQGVRAGDRVRLKVVNAGASSYFWLQFAGGPLTVVGNDGNDLVPVQADRLIIAPSETYDLIVTVPENMKYEFRATAEDRTGYSSLWLGSGHEMPAPTLPRLKYFEGMKMMNDMMRMDGSMDDMGMRMSNQKMDMNAVMYPELENGGSPANAHDHEAHGGVTGEGSLSTLNYDMMRAPFRTDLPDSLTTTLHFTLTGNMNRYVWTLDNRTVSEADRILISKGQVLRLIISNQSMMRHPMHLHGHDFRLLNSGGAYAPLKNVVDIMPMETDTIEFAANQDGNWFFHCHILYHMMAGMGRVFRYQPSMVNPELPDEAYAYRRFRTHRDQRMLHLMIEAGIETNGTEGELMLASNRYALRQMWHAGFRHHQAVELETMFGRYLGVNQWWFPYVGFDYHHQGEEFEKNLFGQTSNKTSRKTFVIGVEYMLPWLVFADARVDGDGRFRFQLSREDIPLTRRMRMNLMGNSDREFMVGFRYILLKWLAFSTHYDSDMKFGAGVTLIY